jgi:hypothetical protein
MTRSATTATAATVAAIGTARILARRDDVAVASGPSIAKLAAAFLEEAEWAFYGFLPAGVRVPTRRTWSGVQVFPGEPLEQHYELQLMRGPKGGLRIEVGFHTEHRKAELNEAVLARLLDEERTWRKALGKEPFAGEFLGNHKRPWRRLSETWDDTNGFAPGVAVEAAERLALYLRTLEPLLGRPG